MDQGSNLPRLYRTLAPGRTASVVRTAQRLLRPTHLSLAVGNEPAALGARRGPRRDRQRRGHDALLLARLPRHRQGAVWRRSCVGGAGLLSVLELQVVDQDRELPVLRATADAVEVRARRRGPPARLRSVYGLPAGRDRARDVKWFDFAKCRNVAIPDVIGVRRILAGRLRGDPCPATCLSAPAAIAPPHKSRSERHQLPLVATRYEYGPRTHSRVGTAHSATGGRQGPGRRGVRRGGRLRHRHAGLTLVRPELRRRRDRRVGNRERLRAVSSGFRSHERPPRSPAGRAHSAADRPGRRCVVQRSVCRRKRLRRAVGLPRGRRNRLNHVQRLVSVAVDQKITPGDARPGRRRLGDGMAARRHRRTGARRCADGDEHEGPVPDLRRTPRARRRQRRRGTPCRRDIVGGASPEADNSSPLRFRDALHIPTFRACVSSNFLDGWIVYGIRVALVPLFIVDVLGGYEHVVGCRPDGFLPGRRGGHADDRWEPGGSVGAQAVRPRSARWSWWSRWRRWDSADRRHRPQCGARCPGRVWAC